ncbi:aminopeptidase Q [Drosophila ficusphila]|uniref:aminopeptidase Q n=1 Tax=Drosophila ficusphila TaxID=30025 RepID=UPI001C895D32|nr:aminopeptidase Q [Drosophila ficusphila]
MPICLCTFYEVCRNNIAFSCLLFFWVLFQVADSAKVPLYNESRLPTTVTPFHYDLRIITFLENPSNLSYHGSVNISFHAEKVINEVVLHVAGVSVEAKKIKLYGETEEFQLRNVRFNKHRRYMIVSFNKPLGMGKSYVLSIKFGRPMSNEIRDGYFIRHYVNSRTSEKIWYSVSHFDRNFIRNTLPCFDEPALRTTFNVTMGHHKRFLSYSNMNVRAVLPNHDIQDYVWSVHEVTPLMPVHLLAFSVNNFTCRFSQAASANPIRFRTCSQPSDVRETSFAAEGAPQILEFLDELLQVHLPLEKIDQLVMDDFPNAAMNTFGLVVYQSKQILQREDGLTSGANLQALQLIAHEMAHMWFGNLLGMESSSDLWLIEGLTGYFETLAVDHFHPGMARQLLLRYRETAFMYESQVGGVSLSPIWPADDSASEVHMYQKASSLIYMVNSFLGNVSFYDGLQRHLWQNSFTTSNPENFWRSLQLASERESFLGKNWDVRTIMNTWILQRGYPLITVTRKDGKIILSQSNALNKSSTDLWWIPLTYVIQGEPFPNDLKPSVWLSPLNNHLQLYEMVPETHWILLNLQAIGYYRVNYDEKTWQLLATTLYDDFRSIHVLNRAQIVSDILFLLKQKLVSWSTALNVIKYIIDEDEYEPLMAFVVGVTNGFWGISPESALSIAKWLGIAGRWYAEFITYTFDKFVLLGQNLNSRDFQD